jgi:G3E family GTPase
MTKVNIISGFLGAGKTTLIKKLLAGGGFEGEKLVLLENEYGEVGVDGAFMKNTGIEITELNSGCICCTLAGDFHDALLDLIDKYHPDRVIIEPSGVGKLSEVRNVIAGLSREVEDISLEACATVCDVNRARVYARNFGEFFTDQIESAECVILSRTQMTTPEKLEKTLDLIRSINSEARIVTTPWEELDAATLLNAITADRPLVDDFDDSHEHDEHCDCGHDHEHHDHEHEHHDHDHEHHDHEHHDHDHEHHHHEHGHDADEVFDDIGVETAKAFTQAEIEFALDALHDVDRFGSVLRAKGVVKLDDGEWVHFDYVPGAGEIRRGEPDYTGRLCVIGVGLDGAALKGLFGL